MRYLFDDFVRCLQKKMKNKYKGKYKGKYKRKLAEFMESDDQGGSDSTLGHFLFQNEHVYVIDNDGVEHGAVHHQDRLRVGNAVMTARDWLDSLGMGEEDPFTKIFVKDLFGRVMYIVHLPNDDGVMQTHT